MNRFRKYRLAVVVVLLSLLCGPPAAAAIYRWDNGALITTKSARSMAQLSEMDLSYADLAGARLYSASLSSSDLTFAHLMGANLMAASLNGATLSDADLDGAVVTWTSLNGVTGLTAQQLYSTASYQGHDLSGIGLGANDLSGWHFAGKNLTGASFEYATLTDANFHEAVVTGTSFNGVSGLTFQQFSSTATYQTGNLSGIGLSANDLSGWIFGGATLTDADLSGANLTGADFRYATLTDADLSGAVVTGANFRDSTSRGFTAAQLYSTASYQSGDLSGIGLSRNDLTGWHFAGKNLTGADFYRATLTDADLSGANLTDADFGGATLTGADLSLCDLRGANIDPSKISSAASSEGAILPDGRIEGLALDPSDRLVVRDYELPITVESRMGLDPESTLRMVFEDDSWGSTISFEPGIAVSLGGSLELLFADGTDPADLSGTTFDLFDWDGAVRSGEFEIVPQPGTAWDTTHLYTTGEVTLTPEPSTLTLLGIAAVLVLAGTARFGRRSVNWCP